MIDLPPIALSVRQPWAWAIIHAGKDIENRSAAAIRHGMTCRPIAIHAAKGITQREYADASDFMAEIGIACPRPDLLTRGAVIGLATVTDIVADSPSPWWMGPRGLVLTDARPVAPIPATGALGYFQWHPSGQPLPEPLPWMRAWGTVRIRKSAAMGKTTDLCALPLFGSETP